MTGVRTKCEFAPMQATAVNGPQRSFDQAAEDGKNDLKLTDPETYFR